jgi:hypothetical protein
MVRTKGWMTPAQCTSRRRRRTGPVHVRAGVDRRPVGDVEEVAGDGVVVRGEVRRLPERLRVDVDGGNPRAAVECLDHHRAADAAAGAGDDQDLVRELHSILQGVGDGWWHPAGVRRRPSVGGWLWAG